MMHSKTSVEYVDGKLRMNRAQQIENASMPGDYQLHDRLGFQLSRLSRMMQTRLEKGLAEHQMTRLKWCVLSGVAVEGYNAPSDLADHVGITRPAMSKLIKSMIRDGLIKRQLVETDGRSRQISATRQGLKKLEACWPMVNSNQEHFLQKLSSNDRKILQQILGKMIRDEVDIFDDL